MVQWLRLCALNTGDTGSIPSQETKVHILQGRAKKKNLISYKTDFPTWKMCLFLIVAQMEVLFL